MWADIPGIRENILSFCSMKTVFDLSQTSDKMFTFINDKAYDSWLSSAVLRNNSQPFKIDKSKHFWNQINFNITKHCQKTGMENFTLIPNIYSSSCQVKNIPPFEIIDRLWIFLKNDIKLRPNTWQLIGNFLKTVYGDVFPDDISTCCVCQKRVPFGYMFSDDRCSENCFP